MDQSKVTVRYAKALFSLAKEKNLLEEIKADASLIEQLTKESADFVLLLESPVIKTSQKISLLKTIFVGKVSELTINFLILIAENRREIFIAGMCRHFLTLYRHDQGVKSAVITTAIALQKDLITQINKQLESQFNTRVELSERVDSDLIGGFVLRVDDRQIDASLATQLRKVKEQFLQTEINK
ncbi:ATP synthase F1 subunit delta [Sunxiuqinia sp. sy24]|uniref:ATP synthase F1 subunit delta n=1 Tax=Sunxiuqinia sp. sy24 TaxID=3461495 RepID=UPI0040455097